MIEFLKGVPGIALLSVVVSFALVLVLMAIDQMFGGVVVTVIELRGAFVHMTGAVFVLGMIGYWGMV